jgi:hypothetical protein
MRNMEDIKIEAALDALGRIIYAGRMPVTLYDERFPCGRGDSVRYALRFYQGTINSAPNLEIYIGEKTLRYSSASSIIPNLPRSFKEGLLETAWNLAYPGTIVNGARKDARPLDLKSYEQQRLQDKEKRTDAEGLVHKSIMRHNKKLARKEGRPYY